MNIATQLFWSQVKKMCEQQSCPTFIRTDSNEKPWYQVLCYNLSVVSHYTQGMDNKNMKTVMMLALRKFGATVGQHECRSGTKLVRIIFYFTELIYKLRDNFQFSWLC